MNPSLVNFCWFYLINLCCFCILHQFNYRIFHFRESRSYDLMLLPIKSGKKKLEVAAITHDQSWRLYFPRTTRFFMPTISWVVSCLCIVFIVIASQTLSLNCTACSKCRVDLARSKFHERKNAKNVYYFYITQELQERMFSYWYTNN